MKQSTLAFPTIQRLTTMAALVLGALFLGGCATEGAGPVQAPSNAPAAFELTIAHINDHHSQLDAFAATELVLDGVPTQVELGGFARQTSLFKSVAGTPNPLKLHAGDARTGSLDYPFFKG